MTYVLALAAAALWGGADFLGGLTSRVVSTVAIVVVSQAAGLALLAVLLPLLPPAGWTAADAVWGGAAGLSGGVGVALLYRALAVGRMAVVAPTTAVCAVLIPVAAGLLQGERLSPHTFVGIALALAAIGLVGHVRAPEPLVSGPIGMPRPVPAGMGLALVSGISMGLFYLTLARTASSAGLWPLVFARVVSIGVFSTAAWAGRRSLRMPGRIVLLAVGGGVLDMLANALYLVAARSGPLSAVVTLASLYPAATVTLAGVVLGERIERWQWAGIGCALAAIVLIVRPA